MSAKFYYRRRIAPAFVGVVVWIFLWWVIETDPDNKLLASFAGCSVGILSGTLLWRRIRRGIYPRNRVIVYTADGASYAILIAVFMLSLLPRPHLKLLFFAIRNPLAIELSSLGLAATVVAYSAVLIGLIAKHERVHGPLEVKELYARSVVGAEGMIGLEGTVVATCAPEGTVAVRAELWNAVSIDGQSIPKGSKVVIRDLEGLQIVVQRVQ